MIEKLLERWLDKADERGFQGPFAYALTKQGYTVVHISRHCGMELGKDILAIDKEGQTWAYQLKAVGGGRLTLSKWRNEVQGQMQELALGKVVHPSIRNGSGHKSVLVLNGNLDEEVQRSIDDFNRAREEDGTNKKIEVIVKGQLFEMLKKMGQEFWPAEPADLNALLDLHINEGRGQFPKGSYSNAISSIMRSTLPDASRPSPRETAEQIFAGAIMSAMMLNGFTVNKNYLAEIEAWTLFFSHVLLIAERWNIDRHIWEPAVDLVSKTIFNLLENLSKEVEGSKTLSVGNPMTDFAVLRVRITHLVGLFSVLALWRKKEGNHDDDLNLFIRDFCKAKFQKMLLWGEYATPQFLSYYIYRRTIDGTLQNDQFLYVLINAILKKNLRQKNNKDAGLPTPYYGPEEFLPFMYGIGKLESEDSLLGGSYSLEGIFHLYVRRNWKNTVKLMWPDITRMVHYSFVPKYMWQFYLWRSKEGEHISKLPELTQQWDAVRRIADESAGNDIPILIKEYPELYLLLMMAMPHRLSSSGMRWVVSKLRF